MTADAQRILIVEDDESIATALALNLKIEGYTLSTVHDGATALQRIAAERPHLVLLDISLPKKNGLDVLRELRAEGDHTPVIILSARQEEFDKVAALRLGADDYVTKPFALAELLARVVAVLRRTSQPGGGAAVGAPLSFSDVVIDLDTRTVTRGAETVKLTHREFELLVYFAQNPAKVFSREHLLRHVWDLRHGGSRRTVDNFVAQLRGKLEDDPEQPRHLVTVRGSGYRFDP
jgi:two-component system alkaline phosphatase synthesis response regulator PhoP